MTGEYTKIALRHDERWETAPVQQGRALLDHELNLDPVASVRRDRRIARDAIGAAGVVEGSGAFEIGIAAAAPLDLSVGAGHMWVDGHAALAPVSFLYSDQDQIAPLPATGRALVYLDVFEEHVHPAEDPTLVDPALAPTDTAARTRVGYRVRVASTTASNCQAAWAGFDPAALSTGALDVHRVGPAAPPDPCDPPGDALGLVPDGLLRVEVLDGGNAAAARFAWAFDNGSSAVPIVAVAGDVVTLAPSAAVRFANDLVEISWLARRADRVNAGSLYQITNVTPSATGDVLTLDRNVTAPAGAVGLVARRWDGQGIGAAADVAATRGGNDLGIRFRAGAGNYRPGDWWGARVREADGVETLVAVPPDGIRHSFAPLALIDVDAASVIDDCRPTFRPLTELEVGSPCTVVVRPGDDLQAAVDSLPAVGGEVCLSAGAFEVAVPVTIANRNRVRITGVGAATIVRVRNHEAVFRFIQSDEVELVDLSLVAGVAATRSTMEGLNGAGTFAGCRGVTVDRVSVVVPDGPVRRQTAISVRADGNRRPERVRITSCDLAVGAWQVGVLVTDGSDVAVDGNRVRLGPSSEPSGPMIGRNLVADELRRVFTASLVAPVPPGRDDVPPGRDTVVAPERDANLSPTSPAIGRALRFTGPTVDLRLPSGNDVVLVERSPIRELVTEFASRPAQPRRSDLAAFEEFVVGALANPTILGAAATAELAAFVRTVRAVGQGIVVGGDRGGTLRVIGNTVDGALQGVHVGVSRPGGSRERLDDVLIIGNTVHLTVPSTFGRERHAVFVGNADSVQITDTRATVTRSLTAVALPPTPIDAVRLIGFYGAYVSVRGVSARGFRTGVRASPLGTPPAQRMWSISEVMAAGVAGSVGAVAPSTFTRSAVAP